MSKDSKDLWRWLPPSPGPRFRAQIDASDDIKVSFAVGFTGFKLVPRLRDLLRLGMY